jgi:hypothetical protein
VARELLRANRSLAPVHLARAAAAHVRYGLGPTEFFLYDLQNRRAASWADYRKLYPQFSRALKLLNGVEGGRGLFRDKVGCTLRALEQGIAVAPIIALARSDGAEGFPFPVAGTPQDLAAILDRPSTPAELFIKPVGGFAGTGAMAPMRREGRWTINGRSLSSMDLAEHVFAEADAKGTLVQPRLSSHMGLAAIGGDFGLSTIRVNTALTTSGPEIFVAAQKVMGRPGLADNFSGGLTGNMLANVDLASGCITDAFGRSNGDKVLMTRMERHPVTGTALTGFAIPRFDEVKHLALRLATAFPESPLLASDIAITDGGVCLIEVNFHWDTSLPQLMLKRGIAELMRDVLPRLQVDEARRREAAALIRVAT